MDVDDDGPRRGVALRGATRGAGALAVATLLLAACSGGVLDPQGPVGANEKTITIDALAIMLAIVIPTLLAGFAFAWWFRASNTRARYQPEWTYSGRIELIVWAIPLLVILFLGGMIWVSAHELDPGRPLKAPPGVQPVEIDVVSLDWKWLFIYPREGVASVNQVVVPAGTPVRFRITSASVMNAFFVPQLGSMIYAMNGMVTDLHLQADHPGAYYGRSAMFSGDGFADMHFQLRSVPAADYAAWIAQARAGGGPALDLQTYGQLAKQSQNVAPFTYRAVQPDLFQAIAAQKVPPASGPSNGRGGAGVSPRSAPKES
ncbi:MAG: Ubiquinol oxidase subunit 2 [Phenylobacterium sp.]|nr:Ubiquinol oxidase subunit 2 [Phenylobacterium sp.]